MTIDPANLEPGQPLLLRATLTSMSDGVLWVTIDGARPPFSAQHFPVGLDDIAGLDEPVVPLEPLGPGDRVRNEKGAEFEVIDVRERDDSQAIVILWSDATGSDWEFLHRLERVT